MENTMDSGTLRINVFDLVVAISRVVDMMSPAVANHHMQVAYLSYRLAEELRLPYDEPYELMIAGALHDVGAFSLKDRIDLLDFEDRHPGEHAKAGYYLLRDFSLFSSISEIIRFHHVPWQEGERRRRLGEPIPEASHILHLADRTAVQLKSGHSPLVQVQEICDRIAEQSGTAFNPEYVDALRRLAGQDYVWMEVMSGFIEVILRRNLIHEVRNLELNDALEFSQLVCRLIDFRSGFTATHSSGVAAAAVALAREMDFSDEECTLIEISAFLHDLGKLAVPAEILEKTDPLTEDEWSVMRSHVYYTYQALSSMESLKEIIPWGAFHQERLNGSGYPFGLSGDDLPLGARILAVADVFTALTEDRPYRSGMGKDEAADVIRGMAENGEIDRDLTNVLLNRYDELNQIRQEAQKSASRRYASFMAAMET